MKLNKYMDGLLQIIFPAYCLHCGSDAIDAQNPVCFSCMGKIPKTNFEKVKDNLVEKIFYGRLPIGAATSMYFFTKDSVLQNLMHLLKYKNKPEIGTYLGEQLGESLLQTNKFENIDVITPVPLSKKRQMKRGYNQAMEICKGVSNILDKPITETITFRIRDNETQTKKNRQERWENMQNVFAVNDAASLDGKNILLIDDVITTGATLETCAATLQKNANVNIYIATLAIAMH